MSKIICEWLFYIDDMIGFAEKIMTYTKKFSQTDFVSNELNYDATIRNLELKQFRKNK